MNTICYITSAAQDGQTNTDCTESLFLVFHLRQGGYVFVALVNSFDCWLTDDSKSYLWILMTFLGEMGRDLKIAWLDCADDMDHHLDPGIFFFLKDSSAVLLVIPQKCWALAEGCALCLLFHFFMFTAITGRGETRMPLNPTHWTLKQCKQFSHGLVIKIFKVNTVLKYKKASAHAIKSYSCSYASGSPLLAKVSRALHHCLVFLQQIMDGWILAHHIIISSSGINRFNTCLEGHILTDRVKSSSFVAFLPWRFFPSL